MNKKNSIILMLSLLFLFILGPRIDRYYTYEFTTTEKSGYAIRTTIATEYKTKKILFLDFTTKGAPLRLGINLLTEEPENISGVRILSAVLIGQENGRVVEVEGVPTDQVFMSEDRGSNGYRAGSYFGELDIEIQPYLVKAIIEVCVFDRCHVDEVTALLEYTVNTGFGFLFFDRMLSV